MKFLICVAVLLCGTLAQASDLDSCDFNKSNGACSSVVKFDEEKSSYTIPATGMCQTVTVLIDGTQYPHKIKDKNVTDSVMRLDKTKPANVSVTTCTSHPTKQEVVHKCMAQVLPARRACQAPIRPAYEACGATKKCADVANAAEQACSATAVEQANACIGGPSCFTKRNTYECGQY